MEKTQKQVPWDSLRSQTPKTTADPSWEDHSGPKLSEKYTQLFGVTEASPQPP